MERLSVRLKVDVGLPKKTQIVVIDDHVVVRRGVIDILKANPAIEVCGEAGTGKEGVEIVARQKPHVAIADLSLPDMHGAEVVYALRSASPDTAVLVLTMHSLDALVRAALRAGAQGYILKSEAASDLLAAVRSVERHRLYLAPQLQQVLMDAFVSPRAAEVADELPDGPTLSARESEIVRLLARGKSNKQVAVTLGLSLRTVESHRYHIMHKMNFENFSDLVRFALRERLAPT